MYALGYRYYFVW